MFFLSAIFGRQFFFAAAISFSPAFRIERAAYRHAIVADGFSRRV